MSFLEERITTGVRRGTRGGPVARRNMVYDGTGRLTAQQFLRGYPLHKYQFDFGSKVLDEAEAVRDFFYVVLFTPFEGFRVRDWNDYQLTQTNSTLTLVSGSVYQINRVYTAGASSFVRPIYKTVSGTVTIYRTRSGVVTTASATFDHTLGRATISGHAGGDTYTAEGEFDVPVTFEDDDAMANIGLDGNVELILQQLGEVSLIELAPPA